MGTMQKTFTAGTGTCGFHELTKKIAETTAKLTPADRERYEREAEKSLRQATIQLLVKQPFFGLLLCNMNRQPAWNMNPPTMAVDGEHLFFNPVFVSLCTRGEHRADLCHEVLHLAFLHLTRRRGRNPERWNRAVDFAANLVVVDECELPLQSWACYDQKYKGMTAEKIYQLLEKEEEGGGNSGSGENEQGQSSGQGQPGGCPDCQAEAQKGGGQHVMDGHLSDQGITEDEILDKVVRAAEQAKSQGSVPASIDTFLKRLRKHKVDWRKFIRGRALDIFNKKDYRYEIRSIITGPVAKAVGVRSTWLPGLGAEEAKTLVAVIDTSGSVSKRLLKAFASELKGCMELADRTIVITADAAVHEVVEVSKFDDLLAKMKFRGGGGTSFVPAFERLKAMGIVDPELLVYFTDAWGTFPDKKPNFPVIWALTKNHGEVPWGESVVVTDDKDEMED